MLLLGVLVISLAPSCLYSPLHVSVASLCDAKGGCQMPEDTLGFVPSRVVRTKCQFFINCPVSGALF